MASKKIVCKKLKGLMVEHDMPARKLSGKIGISESSLVQKINGHRDWWYWEVMSIVKMFGFSEVKDVFPEIYDSVLKAC